MRSPSVGLLRSSFPVPACCDSSGRAMDSHALLTLRAVGWPSAYPPASCLSGLRNIVATWLDLLTFPLHFLTLPFPRVWGGLHLPPHVPPRVRFSGPFGPVSRQLPCVPVRASLHSGPCFYGTDLVRLDTLGKGLGGFACGAVWQSGPVCARLSLSSVKVSSGGPIQGAFPRPSAPAARTMYGGALSAGGPSCHDGEFNKRPACPCLRSDGPSGLRLSSGRISRPVWIHA
jgi:hypothetical protein